MSSLVEFVNIADEITIRESDGAAIVGIKAAARLAGKGPGSLRYHFNRGQENKSELTEMLGAKGFDGGQISCFSEGGIPDQALGVILKYYAYKAGKRCTAQAEYACDQFQEIGIRATCYAAKGLTHINSAPEKEIERVATINEIKEATEFHQWLYGNAYAESYGRIMFERHQPHLLGPAVPAKERASLKSAEALMTPTEIAEELDIRCKTTPSPDPRAVNRLLRDLGYQEKPSKDVPWSATEKGKPFSDRKPVSTNSKSDKDQLFWYASILDVLRDALGGGVAA